MYGLDYGFDIIINKFNWEMLIVSCIVYIDCIYIFYENVFGKNNVDVIKGFVCFVDVKMLEVNGEIIMVDYILIVIGGCLSYLDILGVEYGIDFDGFFVFFVLLECVVVVGVGYIVVELVVVINGFGVKMYLFVCKYVLLCSFDLMIFEMLVEVMNVEGLQLYINVILKVVVKNIDGSLMLELEDGCSEMVDCLIWVIGCEFVNDNINLEVVGVKINEKGYIVVDKY